MDHPAHFIARRQRAIVWLFVILVTSLVSLAPSAWAQSVRVEDPNAQSFTIAILPDTQIYCYDTPNWRNSSRKEVFFQMTEWIAENVEKENIVFVLHMGDIVTTYDDPRQWAVANKAMSRLDGAVPYCFTVGNHDLAMEGENIRDSSLFNKTFPFTRYEKEPWYGGRMADDGFPPADNFDNSYHFLSAGGTDFLIVNLEVGPTDEMLAWADGVISRYSNRRVILNTHSYMDGHNVRDRPGGYGYLPPDPANTGEEIWQKLVRKHRNMFFVLNGHLANRDDHRGFLASKGDHGNTVYQLLSGEDYDGWMRLVTFIPNKEKILVRTYSPWNPEDPAYQYKQYGFSLPGFNTDKFHQYELPFPNPARAHGNGSRFEPPPG